MIRILKVASGRDFEPLYIDMHTSAYMEAVALFATYAMGGDDGHPSESNRLMLIACLFPPRGANMVWIQRVGYLTRRLIAAGSYPIDHRCQVYGFLVRVCDLRCIRAPTALLLHALLRWPF